MNASECFAMLRVASLRVLRNASLPRRGRSIRSESKYTTLLEVRPKHLPKQWDALARGWHVGDALDADRTQRNPLVSASPESSAAIQRSAKPSRSLGLGPDILDVYFSHRRPFTCCAAEIATFDSGGRA